MTQPGISGEGRERAPEEKEDAQDLPGTKPFSALGYTVSEGI